MKQSIESSHNAFIRPSPEDLQYIDVDKGLCTGNFGKIILFNDVITEGEHFKACKDLLQQQLPGSTIEGIFIARRVHRR